MTKDEALKMAIKALESIELLCNDNRWYLIGNARKACKEALEQTAQEPVAWMDSLGYVMSDQRKIETQGSVGDAYTIPLYTHPCALARKAPSWQGLSDDEIETLIPDTTAFKCEVSVEECIDFARAIEQALKEKNNE